MWLGTIHCQRLIIKQGAAFSGRFSLQVGLFKDLMSGCFSYRWALPGKAGHPTSNSWHKWHRQVGVTSSTTEKGYKDNEVHKRLEY